MKKTDLVDVASVKFLDDKVKFMLFAPDCKKVELVLNNEFYQMQKEKGFWILSIAAEEGDKYNFRLDESLVVSDSMSLQQINGAHGSSIVKNLTGKKTSGKSMDWEESIIYELHIGTFTEEGTIKAAQEKLDYLESLGVNTIELMPIADFPGKFNWGYDGVLLFAPDSNYGTPEEFMEFISAAHDRGFQVILDVVYNHFGPDGNYIYCYAKSKFFDEKIQTPWGNAINFKERFVRDFYIHNVKHWLDIYGFDGLRFDAVHEIKDESECHILQEILDFVRENYPDKHLILENLDNNASWLRGGYTAQWNDDFHHSLHVAVTGENRQYYSDYSAEYTSYPPSHYLGKTLSEGFAYQGEKSYFDNYNPRGSYSADLPCSKFINFIQNHDQVGNRPLGDRLSQLASRDKYKLAVSLYLLAPSVPMLFMGEEWGSLTPFMYFTDLCSTLKSAIKEGRKNEFKEFFETHKELPDPTIEKTFIESKLNWSELDFDLHKDIWEFYKKLIQLRKIHIIPIISKIKSSGYNVLNEKAVEVFWDFEGGKLAVIANFSAETMPFESKYKNSIFSIKPIEKNMIQPYSIDWFFDNE